MRYVKCLDRLIYDSQWVWRTEKIWQPSWDDVETAIRRLDRFHYPTVRLWTTEDESKQMLDGIGQVFEVMGGDGAWWIAVSFDRYFQRRIDYPERGDQEIKLWTSDQGFADAERHVTRDIEEVIRAARHYANHGGFDPALKWGEGL